MLGGLRVPGARASTSVLRQLSVRNAAKSFVGDRRLFATISPRSGTGRAGAILDLVADQPVAATLEVVNRNGVGATVISRQPVPLVAGKNEIPWTPGPSLKPGSYILRLRDLAATPAPVLGSAVVRVMDVEATFRQRSALPGATVNLRVQTDAPWLRLTLLRCGPGGRADQQQLRDARGPGRGAAADRPLRPSRPRDHGSRHARRHRERPLRRAARRPVGAPRLRADHRPPAGPGAARRDRAADDHLAGLQLLRPQRRRVRRHVVLALLAEAHRPRPPAPPPRRPRAVPQLRGPVPPLARVARPRRRHLRRRGHRALRRRRRRFGPPTT